jgi:hypothetical protein
MSNVFNFRRFTQLFITHTITNYRKYLMSFAVLMGILFLFLVFVVSRRNFVLLDEARYVYFTVFLFLGAAVFTTGIFSNLGDNRKAIVYLMLPASNVEKLLVAWLYTFVLFLLLYIPGFCMIDLLIFSLSKKDIADFDFLDFGTNFHALTFFLAFGLLHSMAFLGAVYFKRLHFIKTAFTVFVFVLLIILINKFMLNMLITSNIEVGEPFGSLAIYEGSESYYMKGSPMVWLVPYMTGGIAVLLWLGAYFKLRETEI